MWRYRKWRCSVRVPSTSRRAAGEEGKLFGSVTKNDIARAVQDQLEQDVDARQVRLDEPLRRLGTFSIEIHLHEEVNALVSVEVIAHEEDA